MKKLLATLLLLLPLTFTACGETTDVSDTGQTSVLSYEGLQSFEVLPTDTAAILEADPSIKLIDVREFEEYNEAHIKGALLAPLDQISQASMEELGVTPADNIILYCRSGDRSAQAYYILASLGHKSANSMAGGITKWVEAGLPVE